MKDKAIQANMPVAYASVTGFIHSTVSNRTKNNLAAAPGIRYKSSLITSPLRSVKTKTALVKVPRKEINFFKSVANWLKLPVYIWYHTPVSCFEKTADNDGTGII